MRSVIITGGHKPDVTCIRHFLASADLVIAADSGYDWARQHSIEVDIVVGDMDSAENMSLIEDVTLHRYPEDKDDTDTEIAIHTARTQGAESIYIIGGGGGRLDHLIALLWIFHRSDPPDIWAADTHILFYVRDRFQMQVKQGATVSVFPVGPNKVSVESSGLYWPLNNLAWELGDSGVSNIATSNCVDLKIHSGRVIVLVEYEGLYT